MYPTAHVRGGLGWDMRLTREQAQGPVHWDLQARVVPEGTLHMSF